LHQTDRGNEEFGPRQGFRLKHVNTVSYMQYKTIQFVRI
jgi:hypothetical protein